LKGADAFDIYVGGALVLIGLAIAIPLVLPYVIGIALAYVIFWVWGAIAGLLWPRKRLTREEVHRRAEEARKEMKAQEAAEREEERLRRQGQIARFELEKRKREEEIARWDAIQKAERNEHLAGLTRNVYPEVLVKPGQTGVLLAEGYQRIKISPDGRSGAEYYWVKPRFNEGLEHAFFCYTVEDEVKNFTKEVQLHTSDGPDVVFTINDKRFAIDVETGSNEKRNPIMLRKRFNNYREWYHQFFILVTRKKLKYRYAKYGPVVTRATFRETIKKAIDSLAPSRTQ